MNGTGETIIDLLALLLCVVTAAFIGPLYTRANGTRPLLAGNLVMLSLLSVGCVRGFLISEPPFYSSIRLVGLLALLIPAVVLTHRGH